MNDPKGNGGKVEREMLPHFTPEGIETGSNELNATHEVTLIFESALPRKHVKRHVPVSTYKRNCIYTVNDTLERFWQAVIVPGSRPIRFCGFEFAAGFEPIEGQFRELKKAARSQYAVWPSYMEDPDFRRWKLFFWRLGHRLERMFAPSRH
ncbi:hypothetical protein [Microvirga ossetica]|nr:hypothetical protein [Microvirga ossetica]